jgi:HSP20 family protein
MAEVTVVKQPKPEERELERYFKFDTPLFRGSVFGLNPFALMRQFTEDMDRAFTGPSRLATGAWMPAIEVKEEDGKLLVIAELPGLKKEDVKVRLEGDTLIFEGERKEEKEENRKGFFHSERSYGKFYRSVELPQGAKVDLTAAQFNNGVLEITIPIAEVKTKTKEIPVQEGSKKAA